MIHGAKHSPSAWHMGSPKGDFGGFARKGVSSTSELSFSALRPLQAKSEFNLSDISMKFKKMWFIHPMVVMAVQPGHKRGENDVENCENCKTFRKSQKWSRMILDESREVQGAFLTTQSSIKKVPIWRLGDVQKTPPRSHMNPQNHPKIHKSLVLAHNIHKDCPLGVASISIDS